MIEQLEALKPCPFCGGTDLMHRDSGVWCNNFDCEAGIDFGHFFGGNEEESKECKAAVAKAWNTRSNPELEALVREWRIKGDPDWSMTGDITYARCADQLEATIAIIKSAQREKGDGKD